MKYNRKFQRHKRDGVKDVWNAFMLEGATFCNRDMPLCPCNTSESPAEVISWHKAQNFHQEMIRSGNKDYRVNAFVHFYMDDYKFNGIASGIWVRPHKALDILSHYAGAITPDFSTNQDFPEPIKKYAIYQSRTFGFWLSQQGLPVINNVRWGTNETWEYCFEGIPKHSIVAIGTVGGSPQKLLYRECFNAGFEEMLRRLEPREIVVVGSSRYPCFEAARANGIKVVSFDSETALYFKKKAH